MVALNGTLLAGTLMVKDEEVFSILQRDTKKLAQVLRTAGLPSGQGYDDLDEADLAEDRYPELQNQKPHSGSSL